MSVTALMAMPFVHSSARAQTEGDEGVPDYLRAENKVYQEQYNKEQFDVTDTNDDGFLSKEELKARPAWAGGFFYGAEDERIAHADENKDGKISYEEAKAQKEWEIAHAKELNKKYGKETLLWYNNKDWLMKHPEAAERLIGNSNWLEDHPEIAREMYENRKWLAEHPGAQKALYQNRQWVLDHPNVARKLYNNDEFLSKNPEFKKDAEEFFKQHPEMKGQTETQGQTEREQ
jgi:hypothetical protein